MWHNRIWRSHLLTGAASLTVLLGTQFPAAAAPPDTTTAHTATAAITLAFFDDSDPCLVKGGYVYVDWNGTEGGFNHEMFIVDQCAGELLLDANSVPDAVAPGEVTISSDLTSATIRNMTGPLQGYPAGFAGTYHVAMQLQFAHPRTDGFHTPRTDMIHCIPLEIDPETGDPLPGTQYIQTRLLSTGTTGLRGDLITATGSFAVTLPDGTQQEILTPSATRSGWIDRIVGNVVYQVTGPVDQCTDSIRE